LKSCYLRKRVAIISVKWPLLLQTREALAHPKKNTLACGNSENVEDTMVTLLGSYVASQFWLGLWKIAGWHVRTNSKHYVA
jgi:hypothetical protein